VLIVFGLLTLSRRWNWWWRSALLERSKKLGSLQGILRFWFCLRWHK